MQAEAARPYAERMAKVLGNVAAGVQIGPETPKLLSGTGKTDTHSAGRLHRRARPCAARSNSSISRLARDTANRLLAEGKDRQDHLRGPQRATTSCAAATAS